MTNLPFSEQYRLIAKAWTEEEAAALMLEKTKDVVYSQMVNRVLENTPALSMTRAERIVTASPEWADYVKKMVEQRKAANLKRVQMNYLDMKFREQMSSEASARAESRL